MALAGARGGVDSAGDVPVSVPVPDSAPRPPFVCGSTREREVHPHRATRRPSVADTVWTTEIFVFYDRQSVRTYAQPVRFRSGGQGPEVYVELDGDRFFARELIGCRITLNRAENARIRRVYTRLLGGEWAKADGQQETTETYRTEVSVPMEQIRIGVPFTFEIPIPEDAASSYRGTYSYYSYVLHVGLDIAWGFDIIAQTPIVIVR